MSNIYNRKNWGIHEEENVNNSHEGVYEAP